MEASKLALVSILAISRGNPQDLGPQFCNKGPRASLTTLHFFPSSSNTGACFWRGLDWGALGPGEWLLVGDGVCPP